MPNYIRNKANRHQNVMKIKMGRRHLRSFSHEDAKGASVESKQSDARRRAREAARNNKRRANANPPA